MTLSASTSMDWDLTPPRPATSTVNRSWVLPHPKQLAKLQITFDQVVAFEWGDAAAFGTPAYWLAQYLLIFGWARPGDSSLGANLLEETVACILGGYGVTSEVAWAAFSALKQKGLLSFQSSVTVIEAALRAPLLLGSKHRRYRFARQRAIRISAALAFFAHNHALPKDPVSLRDSLLGLPGVGYKTASWIVRNYTGTDQVAIIDVHVHRAGLAAGFFDDKWKLPRDYLLFEKAFLKFADASGVSAAGLDMIIWDQMRRIRRNVSSCIVVDPDRGIPIESLFPPINSNAQA